MKKGTKGSRVHRKDTGKQRGLLGNNTPHGAQRQGLLSSVVSVLL